MSEYRSQRDINNKNWHPVSVGRSLLLILLGFFVTAVILNNFVTRNFWVPYLGNYTPRIAALSEFGSSVTTVFVGSSHVLHSIHPPTFDAVSKQQGADESSYNMAEAGAIMPVQQNTLRTLGALQLENLDYVIFEPMLMAIPVSPPFVQGYQSAFSTRNRYLYTSDVSIDTIKMRWASDRSLANRLGTTAAIVFVWLVHESNLGVLRDILLSPDEDSKSIAESWEQRGFTGEARPQTVAMDFSAPPELTTGYRDISETELQMLDRFVRLIKDAGAEPVFYFPPNRNVLGKVRAVRDATITRYPDIKFLDYTFDVNPIDIYSDESLWFDNAHLNKAGAITFTKIFAEDWHALLLADKD
jgi:hypothetical protein